MVPPTQAGKSRSLQLRSSECGFTSDHRNAKSEEGRVTVLGSTMPMDWPPAQHFVLDGLMHAPQLDVRAGAPFTRSDATRLVNLHIANRVLAQPVPFVVGEPGRADHRPGLMPGPEAEQQAAAELIAMLSEHARQFHKARIPGSVVSRLRALPGILVASDQHEFVGAQRFELAQRDLHRSPTILDIGSEPYSYGTGLQHFPQLQPRGSCDANARECWHFGFERVGCRIAPGGLHRAKWHRGVARMSPVHHHAANGTHKPGDALLLVPCRAV